MPIGDVVFLCVALFKAELNLFWFWCLPSPFIAQGQDVTLRPRAQQMAPGWLEPYTVGHQRLGVANDVFSGVESILSCPLTTSRAVSYMAPSYRVASHCISIS
jgi:hypothetical protein